MSLDSARSLRRLRSVGAFASCLFTLHRLRIRILRARGILLTFLSLCFLRGTCFWDMEQQVSMKLWSIWLGFSCEKAESQSKPCSSPERPNWPWVMIYQYRKRIKIFLTQFTNIGNSTSDIGKSTDLPILEYQNELPISVIWISDIC